jgi:hypothetical protein
VSFYYKEKLSAPDRQVRTSSACMGIHWIATRMAYNQLKQKFANALEYKASFNGVSSEFYGH